MIVIVAGALATLLLLFCGLVYWQIRRKHMQRWLGSYLRRCWSKPPRQTREVHLILCFADHYEPKAGGASKDEGMKKVQRWVDEYPRQFGRFRDADGKPPRYTFFFPVEEYEPEYLDALAELCRQGYGEVEIHLHHDGDSASNFRQSLEQFRDTLAQRHGLLSHAPGSEEPQYAFIHGNWTLCNSGPQGELCGVNEELAILKETGCYADLTFPSAPHPTQPGKVNVIYYAWNKPGQPGSHLTGMDIGTGTPPDDALILITGPLGFDWTHARWGLIPRLENGCIQDSQPADGSRIDNWLRAGIQVPSRPDWYFVKLHAHGCELHSQNALLGPSMVRFHEQLAERARRDDQFHYHYVTSREMYNLIKAAEAGHHGSVDEARDRLLVSNLHQPAEPLRRS